MVVKRIQIWAVWGPGVLVNEVTDAHSRRSLENNALKIKSCTIYAYFNIAERNLSYL